MEDFAFWYDRKTRWSGIMSLASAAGPGRDLIRTMLNISASRDRARTIVMVMHALKDGRGINIQL